MAGVSSRTTWVSDSSVFGGADMGERAMSRSIVTSDIRWSVITPKRVRGLYTVPIPNRAMCSLTGLDRLRMVRRMSLF